MLIDGLWNLLTSSTDMQSLLGTPQTRTDKSTGIWPNVLPKMPLYPAVVFNQLPGGETLFTMDGPMTFREADRLLFSCYALNPVDAKRISRKVRQVLEGFAGTLSDGSVVYMIKAANEEDAFEDSPGIYKTPIEFVCTYDDVGT